MAIAKKKKARQRRGSARGDPAPQVAAESLVIPQTPKLENLRMVLERLAKGETSTALISAATGISRRHVNYSKQALPALGLAASRNGPVTPSGRKVLHTKLGTENERQAFREAISTSPLVEALGIDVVSIQPPGRRHLLQRCLGMRPDLSIETLQHRVGDMFSWRHQLGLDPLPPRFAPEPRQMTLDHVLQSVIPPDLARNLRRANPWWGGYATKPVPLFRRSFIARMEEGLRHPLASVMAVRGPRQVGKTTAQEQLIADLLRKRTPPKHILRVQFDDLPSLGAVSEPILRIVEWYEQHVLSRTLNDVAAETGPAFIFLDEVQNVTDWADQLKFLVDHTRVHVLVTGSSALQLEQGRDSLAGRLQTIDVGTLTLSEIAQIRNNETLPTLLGDSSSVGHLADEEFWRDLVAQGTRHRARRDRAFPLFSERGGYPLAHAHPDAQWPLVSAQLNETIIRRVISHDLGTLRDQRSGLMIEEVFRLCCRYAGQSPSTEQLAGQLRATFGEAVKSDEVRQSLSLLDRALLVRLVPPMEALLRKTWGAQKLCLIDHALRASWFGEAVSLVPERLRGDEIANVAGHLVESVVGTCLLGVRGLNLAYFPARKEEPEVDFVLTLGDTRIPLEVKYRRRVKRADFAALQHFVSQGKYNASFGILVSQGEVERVPDNVIVVPLPTFLMLH